jgi:hypothetical protein
MRAPTQGVKRLGREADHSPLSGAEVNAWSYTSILQYVFMVWCLIKPELCLALYELTCRVEVLSETTELQSRSVTLRLICGPSLIRGKFQILTLLSRRYV